MSKCSICGRAEGDKVEPHGMKVTLDVTNFQEGTLKSLMIKKACCFDCAFWEEKILEHNENTFIVNHTRYCSEHPFVDKKLVKGFLGFGGRDFYIKTNEDKYIHANNLWCQGDVPEHFWSNDKLKDNATFVTKHEYEQGIEQFFQAILT